MMEGMSCRLELMNWLMSEFQAGKEWSLLSNTTTSSAMVLLSEAVREAWKRSLLLLPAGPLSTEQSKHATELFAAHQHMDMHTRTHTHLVSGTA